MSLVGSRVNPDGSLDVWVGEWHASFPAGGDAPSCVRGEAPVDLGPAPDGLRVRLRDGKTIVRYIDWIVVFGHGEPDVRPAKPVTSAADQNRYYDFERPDADPE